MEETTSEKPRLNRQRLLTALIVAALFAVGLYQALSGSVGFVNAELDDTYLGVCGTCGNTVFVELDAITDVQLVDSVSFGTCVEGEETGNTVSGIYTNDSFGQYTVHAYTDVSAFILVTSPEGTLVFNCSSVSRTEYFYTRLAACQAG